MLAPVTAPDGRTASANAYTGGTIVNTGGTVAVGNDAALGPAPTPNLPNELSLRGGTLETTATGFSSTRTVVLFADGGTVQVDTGSATLAGAVVSVNGVLQSNFTKTGAGTLTLSGTNTYRGITTVAGGTLAISRDGNLGAANGGLQLQNASLAITADGFASSRPLALSGAGTIQVDTGTATLAGAVAGANAPGGGTGTLLKTGAGTLSLTSATSSYAGGTIIQGGTLQIGAAGAAGTGAIGFAGPTGNATATLSLTQSAQPTNATFTNTLANFGTGSRLDLQGLADGTVSYNSANSSITVTGLRSGNPVNQTFTLSNPASTSFLAQSNGQGGTLVLVCYVTGTRIRVQRAGTGAEVAVEHLRVGDRVLTLDGAWKPIRWIGRRRVRCDHHPMPSKVHPVRVAAGTFGEALPYADLWLSPGHALCLDGCLVPVRTLIDGVRIVQVAQDEVTYWHVELDSHDVILANGLPAESYLDTGNRRGFDNASVPLLHFDEDPAPGYDGAGYCLPVVESGPRLSAIRARYGLGGAPAAGASSGDAVAYFVADGIVLAPCLSGENDLRVLVPAGIGELRLVTPHGVAQGGDVRRLGVIVSAVSAGDGVSTQAIALDAAGLYAGFHDVERDGDRAWRWTDGEAHLSPSRLWPDLTGPVLLHMQGVFTGPDLPRAADPPAKMASRPVRPVEVGRLLSRPGRGGLA